MYERSDPPPAPAIAKTPADRLERLEVRGLTYRHASANGGNGLPIGTVSRGIEGIDLTLPRGSFTVVTGRVGSGKSTLLRVLLGLLPNDGGEVHWNGERVADLAAFMRPPRCAYTSQVPRLFSETLRDNILLGWSGDADMGGVSPSESEESSPLQRAIHLAVMEQDIAVLDRGLDTLVGPRGVRLSGGQVQRTAAARMYVREPELLVIDDLSSALDVETERVLWERLDEMMNDERRMMNDAGRHSSFIVHAFTVHRSRRLASPRGAAPGRSHRCAQGWPDRGRGRVGRSAGDVRGDAPAVARRG